MEVQLQETVRAGQRSARTTCLLLVLLVSASLLYVNENNVSRYRIIPWVKPFILPDLDFKSSSTDTAGANANNSSSSSGDETLHVTIPNITFPSPSITTSKTPPISMPGSPSWQQLVHAVIANGVPSDIEPHTTLAVPSPEACSMMISLQPTLEDTCVKLDTPRHSSLRVLLCTRHSNSTGSLLTYNLQEQHSNTSTQPATATNNAGSNTSNSSTGLQQSIYRVRISGPEVLQPAVHYCGRVATAQFTLVTSGSYQLQLLQLYQGFSFDSPPFVLGDVHATQVQLQVSVPLTATRPAAAGAAAAPICRAEQLLPSSTANNDSSTNSSSSSSTESSSNTTGPVSISSRRYLHGSTDPGSSNPASASGTSCPVCTGHSHKGRWVVTPGADAQLLADVQQALQHTCVFQYDKQAGPYFGCPLALQKAATPDIEERPVLEWLPYNCSYRRITSAVGAQCRAALKQQQQQNRVCFIGDSQTRHLYHQVLHLLEGPSAGYRKQVSGFTRAYQVLKSDVMWYFADNYGNKTALQWNTQNCSHVFYNFGQWPLSHAEPQPWQAQRYAQQVQRLALSMQAQQKRHGNKQYWLTTGPTPLVDYQQRRMNVGKGVDSRTDPFLLLFNKVASTVMQAHGIPVNDTYSIASALFDMSYDTAHYIGTVGLAQAAMVANIFCNDLQEPHGSS